MLLQLHDKVQIDPNNAAIEAPWINLRWKEPSLSYQIVLSYLKQGTNEEFLTDLILEKEGMDGLAILYYLINQLKKYALLSFTASQKEGPLLTLIPIAPTFTFEPQKIAENQSYLLSRFCFCRTHEGEMIWETPLHAALIKASNKGAELMQRLAKPCTLETLSKDLSLPLEAVEKCLSLLLGAKMISEWEEGSSSEEKDPIFAQWDFHDLLFHTRSRKGRHDYPYGGVYLFKDKIAPLPIVKSPISSDRISLYRPDMELLKKQDLTFSEVLENRKSRREHGKPITAKQLGEFLFRAARIKEMNIGKAPYDSSLRPSAAGGACHELELYPVIHSCEGIEPGMYHYDPENHQLLRCNVEKEKIKQLLQNAVDSAGLSSFPQVLFEISSRFQRLSWKYKSMAYATSLKGVGTLTQTMYLVATAMNLAPCAIGGGDSDLFAEAIGCNYYEETSVGEFILGSPA